MSARPKSKPAPKPQKSWIARLFGWFSSHDAPSPAPAPASAGSSPSSPASSSSVHFSPGDACLNAIIAQLHAAKKSVEICVFTISDDRISEAILTCHRSRIPVRIITDNEKLRDAGSDIERFMAAGIPVRIDRTEAHMHHKFAVIDGKIALTGSYNWTRSAAIYNMENLLVTAEIGVVKAYSREFQRLWGELNEN